MTVCAKKLIVLKKWKPLQSLYIFSSKDGIIYDGFEWKYAETDLHKTY